MEIVGTPNTIASIEPADAPSVTGAKLMRITFTQPVDTAVNAGSSCGIENLTWTPSVTFSRNTVRNNRARGSLFSTPRRVEAVSNLFDHTSGTAILLCGDCNGWFETGACRDVLISDNTFVNSLTNMFQFTEAVISIYPEIPDLGSQSKYFHSGIVIEGNRFATFDAPVLFAKSVDGLRFVNNNCHFSTTTTPHSSKQLHIQVSAREKRHSRKQHLSLTPGRWALTYGKQNCPCHEPNCASGVRHYEC